MTPEEIKAVEALKAEKEKLQQELKQIQDQKETKEQAAKQQNQFDFMKDEKKEAAQTPSLEEQAKRNAEEKARIEQYNKKIEDTVKFNVGIKQFIDDNLDIIGENIKDIWDISSKRKYANSFEQADELRANILNQFFKDQKHIDALITDKFKAKANEFLGLADVVKNQRSAEFWELFDLAVENLKLKAKDEQLKKKDNGQNMDKDTEKHNQKFFQARSYFIPTKQ
ncbi:MAG: hypothetical protein LBC07_00060 [Elusimicrobiota bacterium]|jgi:uncharacterized protein with HEPN domain|nr:hypothetical protein [Elusimicrobiota bacterium]